MAKGPDSCQEAVHCNIFVALLGGVGPFTPWAILGARRHWGVVPAPGARGEVLVEQGKGKETGFGVGCRRLYLRSAQCAVACARDFTPVSTAACLWLVGFNAVTLGTALQTSRERHAADIQLENRLACDWRVSSTASLWCRFRCAKFLEVPTDLRHCSALSSWRVTVSAFCKPVGTVTTDGRVSSTTLQFIPEGAGFCIAVAAPEEGQCLRGHLSDSPAVLMTLTHKCRHCNASLSTGRRLPQTLTQLSSKPRIDCGVELTKTTQAPQPRLAAGATDNTKALHVHDNATQLLHLVQKRRDACNKLAASELL